MAFQLKLVRRDDYTADIETLDLTDYTNDWALKEGAWQPGVAVEGDSAVEEAIPLMAKSASVDALSTAVQALATKLRQATNFKHPSERYGVWLRAQMSGETYYRQALILEGRHRPVTSIYSAQTAQKYFIREYMLGLRRTPWWESNALTAYASSGGINCVGGTWNYGASTGVDGDTAARITLLIFSGVSAGGGPLNKFWIGHLTNRFGTRTNFQSYWSLRKAAAFDTDTTGGTGHADADAKDGYRTETTFGTVATLLRRATIRVQDVTANYSDQRGEFLVLLRARLSAAGEVRVRLADGLYSNASYRVQSRVPITSTSYQFYELGSVQIPSPGRLWNATSYLQTYALGIDAERVTGSCSLYMDCLVLIPTAEGYCYAEGGSVEYSGSDTRPLYVQQKATGEVSATWISGSVPQSISKPRLSGGIPVGNGLLVVAGQRSTVSTLADVVDVGIQGHERWALLRGGA